MIRSLYSSAAGMNSQQMNLDVIANNLANVNTTGFKKNKIEFQDLLYQTTRAAGSDQGGGNLLPAGIQIGHGSRAVSTAKIFSQGDVTKTSAEMDVAIDGQGFFQVQLQDGTLGYTRDGAFKLAQDGTIRTNDGLLVQGASLACRPEPPTSASRPTAWSPLSPAPTRPRPFKPRSPGSLTPPD